MTEISGGCDTCVNFRRSPQLRTISQAEIVESCAAGKTITDAEIENGCEKYSPPLTLVVKAFLVKHRLSEIDF